MIASRFGRRLRGGRDCGCARNRRAQQLDREMPDDPVVRRRHGLMLVVLLLLEDVEFQQRLVEMLRVVVLVGDVGVADDVHVDIVGAVTAHGRVVAGRVTGVHPGHQIAAGGVVSGASGTSAAAPQKELAAVFAPAGRLPRQFVTMLGLPLGPQTGHVNVDAFECKFLLLLFQGLEQLLLLAISLFPLQLLRRNRLTGTGLRVGVVRRPAWTLLCVLLLAPLGSTVLEPHLLFDKQRKKKQAINYLSAVKKNQFV